MPWVRLDDRFPSHRKVALLSDRAFRLHVSAICWCAENLTDGHVSDRELTLVAHVRGVKATAKQLEDAGLWDRVDGGWVVHDYLDYNPSRDQVLAERKKNAARQEAFRQRRNGKPIPPPDDSNNGRSNGVTSNGKTHDSDTTATRARHDSDTTATGTRPLQDEESQVNAFRNGVTNAAPTRPDPTRPKDLADVGGESAGSATPHAGLDGLTTVPDDFHLNDTMRRWVASTFPGLDPDFETQQFISHFRAEGRRKRNWHDAWQKWIRDSAQYASKRRTSPSNVIALPSGQTLAGTDAKVAGWAAIAEQLRQEGDSA
ncbi:hypothetical protein [Streptomyces sp. NPDC058653]|uniref:hypothetical protein n=1 Tax=Streptomyces sp. NPDC058653 TaxID=3346576 RepID=UPI00365FBCFB